MNRKTWTDERLLPLVESARSVADVLRGLALIVAGGNYKSIKLAIRRLNLDTSHWLGQAHLKGRTRSGLVRRSLSEVLKGFNDVSIRCIVCDGVSGERVLLVKPLPLQGRFAGFDPLAPY
jgi:hypothetical protein